MQGEVKFFLVMDGFGFINGGDGHEYFVHKSQIPGKKLIKGQQVTFDIGRFKSRVVATNVSPIDAQENGASYDRG